MTLSLKILFFILVIFQTNISVAKVFVFDVVATKIKYFALEEKLIAINIVSMKKNIKQEPNYLDDKKNLFDLINLYKNSKWQEMEELHDKITFLANNKKWSRRKLDFMLHEIVKENGKVYSKHPRHKPHKNALSFTLKQ